LQGTRDQIPSDADRLLRADIVAKRSWVSEEATLIQDQPAISKIFALRFGCCAQAALADFCNNIGQERALREGKSTSR
jgi:hypothetical protein